MLVISFIIYYVCVHGESFEGFKDLNFFNPYSRFSFVDLMKIQTYCHNAVNQKGNEKIDV